MTTTTHHTGLSFQALHCECMRMLLLLFMLYLASFTANAQDGEEKREVAFNNGEAVLKGSLVLPENYSENTPVLLMVTGSGLQNRDEEMYGHKPFAVIADALARQGIATLRYNGRGFGKSTGDVVNATTEDFKNDALAGVELLRKQFNNVGIKPIYRTYLK